MDVAVAAAAAVQVASQVADPVAEKVVAEKAVADKVVVEKAVVEKVNEKAAAAAAAAAAAEQEPQPVDRFSQPWNLRLSNVPVRASSLGEELPPPTPPRPFFTKKRTSL